METRITSQTATRAGTGYLAFNSGSKVSTDDSIYVQKLVADAGNSNKEFQFHMNQTMLRYLVYNYSEQTVYDKKLRWALNDDIYENYGQWFKSTGDYNTVVWPMIKLTAASSSSSNMFIGRLVTTRANGSAKLSSIIDINMTDDYASDKKMKLDLFRYYSIESEREMAIEHCKFKYNNQWYGGLKIYVNGSSATLFLQGLSNAKDIVNLGPIIYETHNGSSSTIVNSEINGSIDTSVNAYLWFCTNPEAYFNHRHIAIDAYNSMNRIASWIGHISISSSKPNAYVGLQDKTNNEYQKGCNGITFISLIRQAGSKYTTYLMYGYQQGSIRSFMIPIIPSGNTDSYTITRTTNAGNYMFSFTSAATISAEEAVDVLIWNFGINTTNPNIKIVLSNSSF